MLKKLQTDLDAYDSEM